MSKQPFTPSQLFAILHKSFPLWGLTKLYGVNHGNEKDAAYDIAQQHRHNKLTKQW